MPAEAPFDIREYIVDGVTSKGGFVNAHAHLDRADSLRARDLGLVDRGLKEKWDLVDSIKRESSMDDILRRAIPVVQRQVDQGVTAIGSFVDIDPVVRFKAIDAMDRLKGEFPNVEFVFIHQPLKGIIEEENLEWFQMASERVDILGGLPAREPGREYEYYDVLFGQARREGKRVHVHVDQLNSRKETETEFLTEMMIKYGMEDRVTAVHAISIGAHDADYREHVYNQARRVGLSFIACPTAWIDSRRNDEEMAPIHNSVTPVDELIKYGIVVGLGTDNIRDIFKPENRGEMYREAALLADTCHFWGDLDKVVEIASVNGRRTLGLSMVKACDSKKELVASIA